MLRIATVGENWLHVPLLCSNDYLAGFGDFRRSKSLGGLISLKISEHFIINRSVTD